MRWKRVALLVLGGSIVATDASVALGAPSLRVQVDQKGDFTIIGNTLGRECAVGSPAPIVGTVGDCGSFVDDSSADVFWRSDAPADGEALADVSIAPSDARSTAVLELPPAATVTHAFLYWGALRGSPNADLDATLERPGVFTANVSAVQSFTDTVTVGVVYQSVADVTALVQANGAGPYRVGGVDSFDFRNIDDLVQFAGWSMVVFYQLDTDPPRNLALFDGLDRVNGGEPPQTALLSGFTVPNAGYDAKLGILAYEGDNQGTGDQLAWDGTVLFDANNPATNFFNGTRSWLGAPFSVPGDLPQLTGAPQSMGGIDLDVVDITPLVSPGQTSATIEASTAGEIYWLGAFVTSVSTFKPDFSSATKSAVDINGGAVLEGDQIEYTISVTNQGSDVSVDTILTDILPAQVTLVPGSIEITQGANAGTKTDQAGDDQAEYDAATGTITVRLGQGADAAQGGTMAVGASTVVVFRVTIDVGATGSIENQASISAAGLQGAPTESYPTDGNGPGAGSPPTSVLIDDCGADTDCAAPTPVCDTATDPNLCVGCLLDSQCGGLTPTCDTATKTCMCVPAGSETCGNGLDDDCNGSIDDGCGGSGGAGGSGGSATGGIGGRGGAGGHPTGGSSAGGDSSASSATSSTGSLPASSTSATTPSDSIVEGGGCDCTVGTREVRGRWWVCLGLAAVGLGRRRRRR